MSDWIEMKEYNDSKALERMGRMGEITDEMDPVLACSSLSIRGHANAGPAAVTSVEANLCWST